MAPHTLRASQFNLEKTLNSGQVFHWVPHQGGFAGTIAAELAYIKQDGQTLSFAGVDESSVMRYFALDHPLEEILHSFPNDPAMKRAKEYSAGIRIIRQPAWECVQYLMRFGIGLDAAYNAMIFARFRIPARRFLRPLNSINSSNASLVFEHGIFFQQLE
jgi:8-oxoguanine DNA glycosylase, N-terminal domain